MKFRFYQLYYIVALALLIASLFSRTGYIPTPDGSMYEINNFTLLKPDATVSYSVVPLGVVLIVTAVVNLFGFFVSLFSNFELQKRSSILSMLLIAGYYILYSIYVYIVMNGDDSLATLGLDVGVLFPFTTLVLNFMTFLAVRRTEASILAKAAGFRLRD